MTTTPVTEAVADSAEEQRHFEAVVDALGELHKLWHAWRERMGLAEHKAWLADHEAWLARMALVEQEEENGGRTDIGAQSVRSRGMVG